MSHLTDQIASMTKIAVQAQQLIDALQAQAEHPAATEQSTNHLQASTGGALAASAHALRVVLHVDINPQAVLNAVTSGLTLSALELRNRGVQLREIEVEPRGLGDALIEALRCDTALNARVSPIPLR